MDVKVARADGREGPEGLPLGDFTLFCGAVTTDWWLSYRTLGDPTSPAILKPTCFGGTILNDVAVGDEHTITPPKYFHIFVGMFGGSESTSPFNALAPCDGTRFPTIALADQVRARKKLVESLGTTHLHAVIGFSTRAMQAYQWAVQYPTFMAFVVPVCGSARCSPHYYVFLEGSRTRPSPTACRRRELHTRHLAETRFKVQQYRPIVSVWGHQAGRGLMRRMWGLWMWR